MDIAKSWCACLHAASTWEHGRCSFWNFQQSNQNLSKRTVNRPSGRTSLRFCLSSTKNLVLLLSNERTIWVFAFDCAPSNAFAATLEYTCPIIIMASTCLLLFLKNLLQCMYVVITIENIGRFLIFFTTKLIDLARFLVWLCCTGNCAGQQMPKQK